MSTRHVLSAAALALAAAGAAEAETPLSAIDWLSDSIAAPRVAPGGEAVGDVATSALPEDVSTQGIDGEKADAIGLLPPSVTGLPADLWRGSASADIAQRLRADRLDLYPVMRDLLYTIVLAELDPPADSGPEATVFLARVDTLLALGALEQADELLASVRDMNPEIFRRAFDTALLLRTEDEACEILRRSPALAPTFPARIFCLARNGDWDAAALTLETARALGFVSADEDALLARFLEPALADGAPPLPVPARPSPLVFRLFEAIGEPLPTGTLPRAYAHADLNANTGWKSKLEAAERLAQTGALDPNRLLGLYTERRPAASGGVWDRASAIQVFEHALASDDADAVAATLPAAWEAAGSVELEVAFARLFAERLGEVPLSGPARNLAFRIGLLSPDYRDFAARSGLEGRDRFLAAVAGGDLAGVDASNALEATILRAFRTHGMPVRLQSLTGEGRLGEALLRAMELFDGGSHGDLDELADALVFFRSTGLEDTARRAALQLLLLDRRG